MSALIPCYLGLMPNRLNPSLSERGTPNFRSSRNCSYCGRESYFRDHTPRCVVAQVASERAAWPDIVKCAGLRSPAFSRKAMEHILAAGLTGASFVPVEVSGSERSPTAARLPDYFALSASGTIRIDEAAAYDGLKRCSACGVLTESISNCIRPIAESAQGIDFCAMIESGYAQGAADEFYWLASWRVARLGIQKRWTNLMINLVGDEFPSGLAGKALQWPLQIPERSTVYLENSLAID